MNSRTVSPHTSSNVIILMPVGSIVLTKVGNDTSEIKDDNWIAVVYKFSPFPLLSLSLDYFETGFLCITMAVLKLVLYTRLTSNSEISLPLPPALHCITLGLKAWATIPRLLFSFQYTHILLIYWWTRVPTAHWSRLLLVLRIFLKCRSWIKKEEINKS